MVPQAAEATAQPLACERCGTFTEPAGLHLFRGKRLCAACHALARQSVRLWSTTLIAVVGTISPPAGWILAAVDWWRVGQPVRALLPVAGFAARVAGAFIYGSLVPPGIPRGVSIIAWLGLNLGSVLLGVVGLPEHVRAHRKAGGANGSWIVAIGLCIIPMFCFLAFYQAPSSNTGP